MVRCIKGKKQVFQKLCNGRKFSAVLVGLHMLANNHLKYYFSFSSFFCCRLKKTLHKGVGSLKFSVLFALWKGRYHFKTLLKKILRKIFSSLYATKSYGVWLGAVWPGIITWQMLPWKKKQKIKKVFFMCVGCTGIKCCRNSW